MSFSATCSPALSAGRRLRRRANCFEQSMRVYQPTKECKPDDVVVEQFGEKGLGPGQLWGEVSIDCDEQGVVYAIDHSVRIQVFKSVPALFARRQLLLRSYDVHPAVSRQTKIPISVRSAELFYAIGPAIHMLHDRFTLRTVGPYGRAAQPASLFNKVTGLCFDPNRCQLAVVDEQKHGLALLDLHTGLPVLAKFRHGTDPGSFKSPHSVSLAADLLYVSDTLNHRVQVFDRRSLEFCFSFGSKGCGQGKFEYPRGLAVNDAGGQLAVADWGNHRIQLFDLRGHSMKIVKTPSNKLWWPFSIAFDPTDNDTLLVADYWTNCLKRLTT